MPPDRRGQAKRVCIVTPTHLGSTPRVVKEAQALQDAGFDVTVIAVRTLDSVEERDQAVLATARWRAQRIDLRSRWRRLPARAGKAVAWAAFGAGAADAADFSLGPETPHLASAATATPADLYIAHYPAALAAAAAAARRHGARLAFDAEDFHPGDWPDGPGYDSERRRLAAVERRHLPRCVHVTAASPGIADAYASAYRIPRPAVVLNTFPLADAPAQASPSGAAPAGPSVYWFSQVIGPDRGLETAIRAVGLARARPQLYLRGSLACGFEATIARAAREAGAEERVHLLAPAAPAEMARLAAGFDVGLAAETGATHNRRIALSNKLFTYLLAGVAPLLSDIPAHRDLAAEAGLAGHLFKAGDAGDLARGMDALLLDRDRLRAARHHAFRLARERYHWEVDARALVATATGSLAPERTTAAG